MGLGLGLTVDRLTSQAMEMRLPRVRHAGWTIAARHVGVVVGLAILTPVFTADLQEAQVPAQEAIASLVLDAPLKPEDKIALAKSLGRELVDQEGQVPDLHSAFAAVKVEPEEKTRSRKLERDLESQLRARGDASLPRLVPHRRRTGGPRAAHRARAPPPQGGAMTSAARLIGLPATALVLVAGVLGLQVSNGGGDFEPLAPPTRASPARSSRRRRASTPSPSDSSCSASTGPRAAST